ncbi:pilus assembly protein CpaE [Sphingomonas sp. PL-96]|uniref:AAA family ATPase n=1 Tax=Sphingomonas sp. PL-96 TaxID=2887201 RepID=UPI001E52843E|nr:pilus assembly protein CpaE [Sphingomonas sp. PL-96]MCC2976888.1 pilus assembly protein CpaE [Sphingomonas sp. PL-96]
MPDRSASRDPFAGFVTDEASADVLRPVVQALGWQADKVQRGNLRSAVQALSVASSPHVLFVDLSESSDPTNDINALAEVCEPGTVVIATGQVNDVRLYRDLVASGIQDYLLKPLNADAVRDAFTQAQAMLTAPKANDAAAVERPHCAAVVVGTRGGAGASTVATSLAWLVSERAQRSTALLDLDVHFGTDALALDLEPGRGLTDAIENPSRIDGLFIERAMVRASDRLAVLSAEAPINSPILTDGSVFGRLQEEMRNSFECTIVDLPRSMLVNHPQLAQGMPVAVVVTEYTLAAARDAIRILAWFRSNVPEATVLVVANRVQPAAQMEISRKEFETSIERGVDYQLVFDAKLAAQAAKLGKPLAEVGKGSKTVAPLVELAARLIEITDASAGGGSRTLGGPKAAGGAPSLLGKLGLLRSRVGARAGKR